MLNKPRAIKKINEDLSITMFRNRNRVKLFSQERKVPLRPFSISPVVKRPIMIPPFKDKLSKNLNESKLVCNINFRTRSDSVIKSKFSIK